jgi:hypothetical protein
LAGDTFPMFFGFEKSTFWSDPSTGIFIPTGFGSVVMINVSDSSLAGSKAFHRKEIRRDALGLSTG